MARVDDVLAPTALRRNDTAPPACGRRGIAIFSALDPGSAAVPQPPRRPRFLFVGRLFAPKGIVPLLEEFAALPQYDLEVVGDGESETELRQRFAGDPNIHFRGRLQQPALVGRPSATALGFPSLVPDTLA